MLKLCGLGVGPVKWTPWHATRRFRHESRAEKTRARPPSIELGADGCQCRAVAGAGDSAEGLADGDFHRAFALNIFHGMEVDVGHFFLSDGVADAHGAGLARRGVFDEGDEPPWPLDDAAQGEGGFAGFTGGFASRRAEILSRKWRTPALAP